MLWLVDVLKTGNAALKSRTRRPADRCED